jgi:hypothetical protein
LLLYLTLKFRALNLKEKEEVRMSENELLRRLTEYKKNKSKDGGMKTAPRNS